MWLTVHNFKKNFTSLCTNYHGNNSFSLCSMRYFHNNMGKSKQIFSSSFTNNTKIEIPTLITSYQFFLFNQLRHKTGVSVENPSITENLNEKDEKEKIPTQNVCILEKLDLFSKSRMLNYLSRHSDIKEEDCSSGRKASPFSIIKTSDKKFFQAEMLIPVETLVSGVMQRTNVRAVGFAKSEKDAIIAACMHGERSLDSLGIPLFTSDRLQRKRAEEAKREGRYAPMPGDPFREVKFADLPFPILYKPENSIENNNNNNKSSHNTLHGNSNNNNNNNNFPILRSYQPHYHTSKRRYNDFSRRSGGDPFLRGIAGELAYLQACIFQHNTQIPGMEDEDGEDENASFTIDPLEVELLQPQSTRTISDNNSNNNINFTGNSSFPQCPAVRLALVNSRPVKEHRIAGFIDESEGGSFDLVEGEKGTWWVHDKLPGLVCLFDPFALDRINTIYKSELNAGFESCVETRTVEELTQVDIGFGPNCQKNMKWYISTAPIPGFPSLKSIGKAMSLTHSVSLCAMHAELILCFLGIPLSSNLTEQTKYFDACLRHGRLVSPIPRELNEETKALLPKPLKQWPRIKKTRKRGSPLSVAEKLVALNRHVVADIRQHLIEVDICSESQYNELFDISMSMLRQFMIEQRHPYEAAYVDYVYSENNQYRCSIYLPLPEKYGVRGGNAIGATPENARKLCALHAIDTLCALNIPITRNTEKMQRLLELRKEFGLILPRDTNNNNKSVFYNIRSPPGYRDVPGVASKRIPPHQDVWNLMMADASDFDVAKDVDPEKCYKLGLPDTGTILRGLFQSYLLTVGYTSTDQWSRMKHYQGMQHWNGKLRIPCNNYWMELPVDENLYGRRIALGRCIYRKTAEKAFLIHAFRILYTLRLAPWDIYSDNTLKQFLRSLPKVNIDRERRWWEFVVRELITPTEENLEEKKNINSPSLREAEVIIPPSSDLKSILSPNPVMTHELAKKTFI